MGRICSASEYSFRTSKRQMALAFSVSIMQSLRVVLLQYRPLSPIRAGRTAKLCTAPIGTVWNLALGAIAGWLRRVSGIHQIAASGPIGASGADLVCFGIMHDDISSHSIASVSMLA